MKTDCVHFLSTEQGPRCSPAGASVSPVESAGEWLLWLRLYRRQHFILAGPRQTYEQTGMLIHT